MSKRYHSGVKALNDIDLEISKGMFGLLGPNGAGKTTFMQIITTILPASSGIVLYDQLQLGKDDHEIRRRIGYLPQYFGLYKNLSGEEFLDYIAIIKGLKNHEHRKKHIQDLLELVNLNDKKKDKIKTYSGGMKQRIGIAQALVGNPEVVIVDEPTAGLDPEERVRFRNLLSEFSDDRIVLLSTHIVADIEHSCSSFAVMDAGKVKFYGDSEQLIEKYRRKIWTGQLSEDEWNMLPDRQSVISRKKVKNGYEVRLFAENRLPQFDVVSEPTLEDAYMALMGSKSNA
ncbi:ABC transporter ATP-binding protein [Paenibacillus yanchengensis]